MGLDDKFYASGYINKDSDITPRLDLNSLQRGRRKPSQTIRVKAMLAKLKMPPKARWK